MRQTFSSLLAVGIASLVFACAKDKPAQSPELTPAAGPAPKAAPAAQDDEDPNKGVVTIDPKIMEMCNIPVPHFEFDSSALSTQASDALNALAACFVNGPAAGKNMRLVGHADPRGTDEYNLALGQRRAASVADYLGAQGLQSDRMETSSRGELDAIGTDESTWAEDRKVAIFLAE